MGRRESKDWFKAYAPGAEEKALKSAREGVASPRIQKLRRLAIQERSKPKSLSEMEELLTPKEVMAYLKCKIDHVYDLVRDGSLECQPDSSRIMISVSALHDYLSAQKRKRYG